MTDAFVYLAEITAYDPDTGTSRVLRVASGTGFITAPTDTPADTLYDPVIAQPVELTRAIYSPGTTEGQSKVGYGDLVLHNVDAELDFMVRLAIDGREVVVKRAPAGATSLTAFAPVFVGTADRLEYNASQITLKLRDRQAVLQRPIQTTTYAGTNALPNGLEGVADLAGKPKPLVFGRVFNIELPCVNTARLIYQAHDGALASVDAVYDRGVSLPVAGTYATLSDLQSIAPAPGTCMAYLPGGYIRLGASPVGQVTADVTQGATVSDRSAAALSLALLERMGVHPADVSASDLAALQEGNPAELGLFIGESLRANEAIDAVAQSVGAWWGVAANGTYRIARLRRPTGTAVHTFTADDIIGSPQSISTADVERGMPAYAVTVRYARNWTVQADVAAGVSNARRAFLAEAWREARVEEPSVLATHVLAVPLTYDALFVHEADALAEAARRLRLRSVRRYRFDITVPFDDETAGIDLGDVIGLRHPRFGLTIPGDEVGQKFVVLGVDPDARGSVIRLTLWGNSFTTYNLVTHLGEFLVTDAADLLVTDTR